MLLIHLIDWVSNCNCLAKVFNINRARIKFAFLETNYWTISWQVMQPSTFMFWCYTRYYKCTHIYTQHTQAHTRTPHKTTTCAANISLAYFFCHNFNDTSLNIMCIPFFFYTWQLFAISSCPHILINMVASHTRMLLDIHVLAVIFNFDHQACKCIDMCMCFTQLKITTTMFGKLFWLSLNFDSWATIEF